MAQAPEKEKGFRKVRRAKKVEKEYRKCGPKIAKNFEEDFERK